MPALQQRQRPAGMGMPALQDEARREGERRGGVN